jgi:hypothetical protein
VTDRSEGIVVRESVVRGPPGWGVGRGAIDPTLNETSRAYGEGQDPHRVVAPVGKITK